MGTYSDAAKAALATGKATSVSTEMLRFAEGMEVVGEYLGRELIPSKKRKQPDFYRYSVRTDNGVVTFLASAAYDKTTGAALEEGRIFLFIHKGFREISGNRRVKVIETYHIPEPPEESEGDDGEEEDNDHL